MSQATLEPAARALLPARAGFVLTALAVASVAAREEVVQDEVGDVATEPVPTRQVVAEMDARENAALCGLIRGCREARERAFHSRQHF